MDKATAFNYGREYAERIKKIYPECKIVLYGSYVDGNYRDDSDIDIAVIFEKFSGDKLKASNRLWFETMKICTLIEPILLDSAHDSSGFCEYITENGVLL